MKEKFLSILLTLCMALSLLPATAWAEDAGDAGGDASGTHTNHCVCGATHEEVGNGHENITDWQPISTKNDLLNISTAGNYYLTDNITLTYDDLWKPADGEVLCLNGHSITGPSNNNVIYMVKGSEVTFTLTDCKTTGTITNTSGNGSGVYVDRSCTFNMYGGKITGNNADNNANGSGVLVYGTFKMYGGEISGNTATYGGGVYVYSYTSGAKGTFNMYGGEISGNTATFGGGVYVNGGTFTMTGGEITSNNATEGGGVIVYGSGTFNMTGGEITSNNATGINSTVAKGGGVSVYGTMTVSGSAKITGNKKKVNGTNTTNNVYLQSGNTITINGTLTGGANSIGVTTEKAPTDSGKVQIATGADKYKVTDKDRLAFVSDVDNTNNSVTYNKEDKAFYLIRGTATHVPEHEHPICGATCSHTTKDQDVEWKGVSTLTNDMAAGNYYLTDNVELSGAWEPATDVVLCLNGHSITQQKNSESVIKVDTERTFTLTNCKDSGTITHETKKTGRGVSVSGTFKMYGGEISGNTTTGGGGGVDVAGTFTMYGGEISGNNAEKNYGGGGVYVAGTFTMTGGNISGNTSTSPYGGGGVYVSSNQNGAGTFTMNGGEISGNNATGNNAENYGGGVRVNGKFTMTGGSITGNKADSNGGGVYVEGTMNVSGSAEITGNKKGETANNVYLDSGKTITINGELDENAKIYVTTGNTPPVAFAKGAKGYSVKDTDKNAFKPDVEGYTVTLKENALYLTTGGTSDGGDTPSDEHKHFLCGDNDNCTKVGHTENSKTTFTQWTDALATEQNSSEYTAANSLPKDAGNYYLTKDVKLASTWKPANGVVLCLNGNTITSTSGGAVIAVDNGRTFTLTDCKDSGKITHKYSETIKTGRGVNVSGNFVMYGGEISDNTDSVTQSDSVSFAYGGGVYVNGGTFTMHGGEISGNIASSIQKTASGGGVYVYNGIFNMHGGEISDNIATSTNNEASGGGVYVTSGGKFNLYSGSISGNATSSTNPAGNYGKARGGGVYVYGTFTMSGGSISNNTVTGTSSTQYGGGVYVYGTFTMSDGNIIGNAAKTGGGVYVYGTFTMSDGNIIGNAAKTGGGVYVYGTFTMSCGEISGNNATIGNGGGVYASVSCNSVTVSETAKIIENVKGGGKNTGDSKYTGDTKSNVYLPNNKTITIGTGGLNSGASIGVTTEIAPNANSSVTIATSASNYDEQYFHSDVTGYSPVLDNGKVQLVYNSTPAVTVTLSGIPSTITYGDAFTLTANVTNADTSANSLTWTSNNSDVLTVTANGNGNSATVKALKSGTAQITVSYGSATATTGNLTVAKRELTAKYDNKEITVGDAFPNITITYGNFAEGDTKEMVIESDPGYYLKRGNEMIDKDSARNNAGTYTIIRGNGSFVLKDGMNDKYKILNVESGTLTVKSPDTSGGGTSGGGSSSGGSSSGGGGGSSKYAVTASSADNGNVTLDKTSAKKGSTVTITPQAKDGFVLDKITVTDKNGSEIKLTDNGDGTFTFTMPASKVAINTTFKEIEKAPVTEPPKEEVKNTVVKMQINSKRLIVDGTAYEKDAAPVIRNDRTLVPIRFITESLGGKVTWNEKAKEVVLTIDGKEIKMTIGKTLEKYGVAPIIMDDRTLVPIRFVTDELGATVAWDEPTKTVTVTKQ